MAVAFVHIPENEYQSWLTPKAVLAKCPNALDGKSNALALLNRARVGRVLVAAEFVEIAEHGSIDDDEYVILPPEFWYRDMPVWPGHFWSTGDQHAVIQYDDGKTLYLNATGIRFDPEGVGKLCRQLSGESQTALPAANAAPTKDERKPPAEAELKRFCRAMLSEWPDASEDWIREKADLFYPDNRIRRDPFRVILREIRGPTLPGKKRKTTD